MLPKRGPSNDERMKRDAGKLTSPGAWLWSQTPPQRVLFFERAAAGASAFAALRRDASHPAALPVSIPTGLCHSAQGCEERAALGQPSKTIANPNGVASVFRRHSPKRFQGCEFGGRQPR